MSYGFKLLDASGNTLMSTNEFGIQIVDDFTVSSGSSGSRVYNELYYHNKVFATTMSDIPTGITPKLVAGHSFMNITITTNASNIPTVSWSTSNALGSRIQDGVYSVSGGPPQQAKPDTRIIVLAG
jgi:hypothetical protein